MFQLFQQPDQHQVPHLPRKSHRQSSGDQGTPGRTSDPLHRSKCRPRKSHRDARAYIRPLAQQQVPHLPRKSHRQSGGDQGMPGPGRTSDRLQSTTCRTCHASESASEWVSVCGRMVGGRRREEGRSGYSTKNTNPTRQCGEQNDHSKGTLLKTEFSCRYDRRWWRLG